MRINIPQPNPNIYFYLNSLYSALSSAFISVVSRDEATTRIILQSPNGTIKQVTLGDDMNLHIEDVTND